MAQWLQMFSGNTHSSLVRDRTALVLQAIEVWNVTSPGDRTEAMRKKLIRLADDLLRSAIKEKKAYLDRTFLDRRSEAFQKKAAEVEQMRKVGPEGLLASMGAVGWSHGRVGEQGDSPQADIRPL